MRWKRGSRLRLISEADASPRTREIFCEVRERLGLPVVPLLYQAYAVFPEFLELHWQSFRPLLESRQFFVLGARLAAECYTRAHNYFAVDGLAGYEVEPAANVTLPLTQVLDYYQYLDPFLLLITAAQMQAFEGAAGEPGDATDNARHASFLVAPRLLSDGEAAAAVQRIWSERRRIVELAFASDEHRALACWPEFYQRYWAGLKSVLQSPLYADGQYRLGESALKLAHELPVPVDTSIPQLLEAGLDNDQVYSLVRVNEAFMQALTGLLLDITFARIGLEGGNRKVASETPEEKPVASERPLSENPAKQAGTP
ncbi:MAG: halocarboxylic acid dehydrogenase DehI family protein, partial [Candidatus Korobacteraceae bacterium]